ncbi:MAG TPA: VWA domain-containing protein [Planctomycetota bacterium]|nr:VWA domain-containing protein [Planctomycetota bacterium]
MITFENPGLLWLLLLIPGVFIFRSRAKRAGGVRGFVILASRALLILLLVGAAAQPSIRRRTDYVTTYFLLDRSGSIPDVQQRRSLELVREAVASKKRKEDRAGLIVFGERPLVEEVPSASLKVGEVFSIVETANTDIGAAVRLALSTFPEDAQKRIVLLTDGNETRGSTLEAIRHATAAGVPVDVVPLKYRHDNEVVLDELTIPRKAERDEPFQVRINVGSLGSSTGSLKLFCDGKLIGARDVSLAKGDNVFVFSHALKEGGFHLFEAQVDAPGDAIPQNNRAQAYTIIEQDAFVLLAGGTQEDVRHVASVLQDEGIAHRVRIAGSLPRDLGEWQSYDVVFFANLGADALTRDQMEMIESLVKDLGAGFIMTGGEKSFGSGGYLNTPIARVLPVDLDVRQSQVLPNGGIIFLMSHIPCIGDQWSKDIAINSLNAMTDWDEYGLYVGGANAPLIPLAPATGKEDLRSIINRASFGTMQAANPYVDAAIAAFAASRSSYRHIVLVTNGGTASPTDDRIAALRAARITMSVVVIEPYGRGGNLDALRAAAAAAGGSFYVIQPSQYDRVPQVWMRESARVKKGLFYEQPFTPRVSVASELLEGIPANALPILGGYNITSRKDPTEVPLIGPQNDPILAHWNCGLGRSVAFTSDASGRWGGEWVKWTRFRPFWAQAIRWCQRRTPPSPYSLTLQKGREPGTAEAIIDAVDSKGRFVNFLAPKGNLVRPDLSTGTMDFQQVGPGRYRASFPTDKQGGYVVNVRYGEQGRSFLMRGGFVPPFHPEYRSFEDNAPLLTRAADETGGRVMGPGLDWFAPTAQVAYAAKPIWPALLVIALILLPLDIFVRRVIVGISDVVRFVRRFLPAKKETKRDPVKEALVAARAQVTALELTSWSAPEGGAEVSALDESAVPPTPAGAPVEPASDPVSKRLMEAKQRARKKFER